MDKYLIDIRTMERGLWYCTGGSDQDHPQVKEIQKGKRLSEEALQIVRKRREAKGKGHKERYTHLNAEFQSKKKGVIRQPSSVTNAKK